MFLIYLQRYYFTKEVSNNFKNEFDVFLSEYDNGTVEIFSSYEEVDARIAEIESSTVSSGLVFIFSVSL